MKKTVLLAFVLLFLSLASLQDLQIAHASPYINIDVGTAYTMITNGSFPHLVVLDVRRQDEYDSGHIYGAVWIPHTELEERVGELAGHEDHETIVYCLSGGRSVTASEILDSYNFTKVYNMLGGFQAWQSAGYPIWIATVHNVNTTLNYDTIQAAIDAPETSDEHTIRVDGGTYREHVTIKKSIYLIGEDKRITVIDGNGTGSVIDITSHHVYVTGFTLRNGTHGFFIETSSYNIISGNIVMSNQHGIDLFSTCPCAPALRNTIRNNFITNNTIGIHLEISADNAIFHNNFINNTQQVYIQTSGYSNVWDDDYPSGGNHWSEYSDLDLYSDPYQNETGNDGIGDTPYDIDVNNHDNYPLMGMFSVFNAASEHYVQAICNSTISDFQFTGTAINFNVSGENGTTGFCRICIPTALMNDNYRVFVNGTEVPHTRVWATGAHSYLYFIFNHSLARAQEVEIIPEFPTFTLMLLVLIMITVVIAMRGRLKQFTSFEITL